MGFVPLFSEKYIDRGGRGCICFSLYPNPTWFLSTARPHQVLQLKYSTSYPELLTPRRKSPATTRQVTTSITANYPPGGCRTHGFQQGNLQQDIVICPFVSAFVTNMPLPAQHASSARGGRKPSSAALRLETCQIQAAAP